MCVLNRTLSAAAELAQSHNPRRGAERFKRRLGKVTDAATIPARSSLFHVHALPLRLDPGS